MKMLAKMLLISSSVLLIGTSAQALKAGLYSAGGEQEICLSSNGTWNSPTFANWGGVWFNETFPGEKTTLVGNYNSGAGNDSMVISGTKLLWNEWSDDLSFVNPQGDLTFTKIGKCTAPAAQGPNKTKNPTD